jgi:hypothetical protein
VSSAGTILGAQNPYTRLSQLGFLALIGCFAMAALLIVAEGLMYFLYTNNSYDPILRTWIAGFRVLFEIGMIPASIVFAGAKLLETRSVITIAFERLDAARMQVKGPDENNVVWIGQRYASRFEADAVAAVIDDRLKSSATSTG